jgi:NAD(P)H dehydrogenase (quinone)
MKIAVTSASGHLGAAIVRALLKVQDKNDIIAIARTPEKAVPLGVEIRQGDYTNKAQFDSALQGVDAVLLVSGMDAPDKRIEQHRNVICAAKDAGVKKIVYTSIMGVDSGHAFSPIVASNRQTEKDIQNSGLNWVIGRNGLYIEPDVEYIDNYIKAGKISNCAADGKCSYTTRAELAFAYSKMLLEEKHNGHVYHLAGKAITQQQLADFMNLAFDTNLTYESMSVEDYKAERTGELGEFLGTIIAGIYESIRNGWSAIDSDYTKAAGREHISWQDYFQSIKNSRG